jgi:LuxR family maltose regulon positive regulatory protein
VAEYLIDEVLSLLPGEARDLLDAICVCDETPADLAAHLSGRADAGAVLETIAQRTSLVVRADPPGYRYHVHFLVRSYLLADLVRQVPDRVRELHGRAADWFAAHDEPAPALTHAEAAADVARVTALLHKDAVALAYGGDHDLIRKALELLGARQVSADSLLALVSALLHLEQGEPRSADRDLAHAHASWPEHPSGDLVSLRRLVSSRLALLGVGPDDLLRTAQSLDPRPGRPLDAAAQLLRASALITTGRRAAAREQLQAALRAAQDDEQDYVATLCQTLLGGLAAVEGDVGSMVTLATAADEMNTRHGRQQTMNAAAASALLAYGALLRAEPAECLRRARRTLRLIEGRDPVALAGMDLVANILCGMAEFELGERIAGARRIHRARSTRGALPVQAEQVALCALLEHHTALLLGWRQTASAALRWCQANAPDSAEVHLMRARTQLSLGRRDAAGKTIQPVLTGSTPAVLPWSLIEAWLLSTEISVNDGAAAGARRSLEHALAVARDLDVPYPVVVAVPEVIDLLTARLGKLGTAERFAGRVLTLRRELAVPPTVPMTARERAVLRLLPAQRSFEEIADDLTVSANTVKTHVRAIYAKLGVTHRRDAVAVALERGLLESEHSGC